MEFDVGALETLAPDTMRDVELDGIQVLLVRLGDRVHAVGAICPHAGAKLSEGVLCDGAVVCPWHKAAFDVATGTCTQPPAWDDLPRYATRVSDGRILVALRDARVFAVVGTGAAGAAAAQTLRAEGFAGRVLLISQEERLPYDRTLLSKYMLSGRPGAEKSPLQEEAFYTARRIERMTRTVRSIDTASRVIACVGDDIAYDAAFVATGGEPRRLGVPGGDLACVLTLRDPPDAMRILIAAKRGHRVVVVGGGFIGMEVAASLRERGLDVVVTAPEAEPLERQLGTAVGAMFRRLHEDQGVRFKLGQTVVRLEAEGAGAAVHLADGTRLDADLVVVGLGITPATGILGPLAAEPDGGVRVDATLCAAPGLYAGGDIAAFPLRGDGPTVRVEHWRVAAQHGRVAALNMLGRPTLYDAVPVFWTIQFMKRLDYVGHAAHWDDIVFDGDLDTPEFVAVYVSAGVVVGVAGFDRDRQMAAAIGLITGRRDWSPEALLEALSRVG